MRGERTHAEDWMNPEAEVKRGRREEAGGSAGGGWVGRLSLISIDLNKCRHKLPHPLSALKIK